jgi:hypothetical protein
MATTQTPYAAQLRALAELMLAVAGESVTMVKRNAPDQALKLTRQEEWSIYLEFLKILFSLADRVSALHLPAKDQPLFMDGLEDAVTDRLKTVLAPALGERSDQMEIVLTIGGVVAESRQRYERYRFLISEESKTRSEMFEDFGNHIAQLLGTVGNGQVSSAAVLCASAVVPAMQAVFEGQTSTASVQLATSLREATREAGVATSSTSGTTGNEIKLVSVMASVKGEEVETRWGLHPRFRQDLNQEELAELNKLMNRVVYILGERYAAVAFSDTWASWHAPGNA